MKFAWMGILPAQSGSVTMEAAELSKLPSYERVARASLMCRRGE